MHTFDVKYTLDNYYEYYKFVLIKQRIVRDIIFALLFVAMGLYWLIDQSDSTKGIILPIFTFAFAVICPLTGYVTLPMLKKQIRTRQDEINRTHIEITFNDSNVVYSNLSEVVDKEIKEEDREFILQYDNFMIVKETKGLFMFHLDRQTVIIIPKETYKNGTDFADFKTFIRTKINPKRIKFLKK